MFFTLCYTLLFFNIYKQKLNMKNEIKKFENFEHNDYEGLEYTLLREIDKSDEYIKFRKHYTEEIKSFLTDNEGRFLMTHQLAGNIIMDVTELIKKLGYEIIKK